MNFQSESAQTGPKILVAEDSLTIRGYLRRTLSAELKGCVITEVGDGAAALQALRGGGFDFMITDIKMPVMDGIELLRILGLEGLMPARGILVLSSSISSRLEPGGSLAGKVLYLRKPVVMQDIFDALARLQKDADLIAG